MSIIPGMHWKYLLLVQFIVEIFLQEKIGMHTSKINIFCQKRHFRHNGCIMLHELILQNLAFNVCMT